MAMFGQVTVYPDPQFSFQAKTRTSVVNDGWGANLQSFRPPFER